MKKRAFSLFAALIMICSMAMFLPDLNIKASATQSKSGNFATGYTLTGNGANDIVAVALKQSGRTQSQLGYTEGWCADFVCDCAKLAGQSKAVPFYGACKGLYDRVIDAGGKVVSSQQKGDLIFYRCTTFNGWPHVAIAVDSTSVIHGNYWYDPNSSSSYSHVQKMSSRVYYDYKEANDVTCTKNHANDVVIVRPNYNGDSPPTPSYTTDKIKNNAVYTISPVCDLKTGMCATGTAIKDDIQIAKLNSNDTAQRWTAVQRDGYWYFINVKSGLYLDTALTKASDAKNFTNVRLYSKSDKYDTQLLKANYKTSGNNTYYTFNLYNTKFVLDVYGDNPSAGATVQLYEASNRAPATQSWVLKEVSCKHNFDYSEENSTIVDGHWESTCKNCGETTTSLLLESPVVTFTQNSDTSVTLSWASDPNASSYKVRKRIDVDSSSYETAYEGTATTFIDNDVKVGEHYIYRVYAYNNVKLPSPKLNSYYIAEHNFGEWVVTTPATYTQEGVETRTCQDCGETETRTIPMLETPETAVNISVSDVTVKPGETGTIDVNIENNTGIISWRFNLDYDSDAIEITGFEAPGFSDASSGALTSDPLTFSWCDPLNGNNTANGTLATISFKVKDGTEPGDYDIQLTADPEDIFDDDFNNVPFIIKNGKITVSDEPVVLSNPTVSYVPGDGCVKLEWTEAEGAEKYAVVALVNGKWTKLIEGNATSYTINGLTAGKEYSVAVIAMFNGKWNNDVSNAITVTPNASAEPKYPVVTSKVQGNAMQLDWTAVPDAQGYVVGYYMSGKWKVLKQLSASTTTFVQTKIPSGTYKVAVIAKVNGQWDTSKINDRAVSVTIG